MNTMHLQLKNIGPITDADIRFGDLTVFVGPQATGKTIALEYLKLAVDRDAILRKFDIHGFDWSGGSYDFFDLYFGEGMHGLLRKGSEAWLGKRQINIEKPIRFRQGTTNESVFYIPAQRVLVLSDGWPQPFSSHSPGVPFVVREFGENLREILEWFRVDKVLFPSRRPFQKQFQDVINNSIFSGFSLKLETLYMRKRLVLASGSQSLPFIVWSAGQREFVPLLLALYWLLMPTIVPRRRKIDWVVLEELEMGLHPRAIDVLLLMTLDLVARGYRVCLSTHSPQVLEAIWAIRHLRENKASPEAALRVFDVKHTPDMGKLAEAVLAKHVKVYYFDPKMGKTKDISKLHVGLEEEGEDGWGGLSEFSGRVNAAVARSVANAERRGAP